MKKSILQRLATGARNIMAVFSGYMGAYGSTDLKRKSMSDWRPRKATANQTLVPTLTTLVAQCRHLDRTSAEARGVVDGLVADVVGSGIDILPNTGDADLDLKVLNAWHNYCENATIDGRPLWEWQASAFRDMIVAGGSLDRFILDTTRIDNGHIPLALLPLEVEWLSEVPVKPVAQGNIFVRGVEVDRYGRPQAYHLLNPEFFYTFALGERVEAGEMLYAFEQRRKNQFLGEPIMAPAVERLMQIDKLIRTELQASVNTAAPAIAITAEVHSSDNQDPAVQGDSVTDMPAGAVVRLLPGEKLESVSPSRPNPLLEPFYSCMVGAVAAGTHSAKTSITRDFGNTTFMNARFEQQAQGRSLAPLKSVAGRMLAGRIYEAAFDWLLIQCGIPKPLDPLKLAKLRRYEIRPDAPPYIDPVKDILASANAIAQNLSTYGIECSSRGRDFDAIVRERAIENAKLKAAGLPLPVFSVSPNKTASEETGDDNGDSTSSSASLSEDEEPERVMNLNINVESQSSKRSLSVVRDSKGVIQALESK